MPAGTASDVDVVYAIDLKQSGFRQCTVIGGLSDGFRSEPFVGKYSRNNSGKFRSMPDWVGMPRNCSDITSAPDDKSIRP